MRRLVTLPLAGLLVLAVAAPAMAGPNTTNTSGSGETIYGEWFGEGGYGYVYLGEENNEYGFGDLYAESGEWVECPPAEEPVPVPEGAATGGGSAEDTGPGEGQYGFVGTRTFGYAFDVDITMSRRLDTGTATGTAELWTETVDECAGIFEGGTSEIVELTVTMTGLGELASFRGMGSYQIPAQFNGHYNYRGKERQATGHLEAGSLSGDFSWGYMSQVTWTEHTNG